MSSRRKFIKTAALTGVGVTIGMPAIGKNVLGNKEEAERIGDQLFESKLMDFFKTSFKVENKELSYDDFVKELYAK